MILSFGTICILLVSATVNQDLPSSAQAQPPPVSQNGSLDVRESGDRAVLKLHVGKLIDATLLNRTEDAAQHETYFFPDPTQRSGVIVFGDDAQGTTIGVVATDLRWESGDFETGWLQERRFWQEKAWCINVTSFGWSEDGRYLFVATCDVYGSGQAYQLDMKRRRAAVIFPVAMDATPEGHCRRTQIEAIGKDSITVHVVDYCEGDKVFARETLPFLTDEQFEGRPEKAQSEDKKPAKDCAGDLSTKPLR